MATRRNPRTHSDPAGAVAAAEAAPRPNGHAPSRAVSVDVRRILPTTDWIATVPTASEAQQLLQSKTLAVAHFYEALNHLAVHLGDVLGNVTTVLPTQIAGTLLEPDGTAAARVAVTARLPRPNGVPPWPDPTAVSNDAGEFILTIPANIAVGQGDSTTLTFRGSNASVDRPFTVASLQPLGVIGKIALPQALEPLQQSVLDQLVAMLQVKPTPNPTPTGTPAPVPQIKLGTDDCSITFDYNLSDERFPYSVLFRLVEPRTSIVTDTFEFRGDRVFAIPAWNNEWLKLFPQRFTALPTAFRSISRSRSMGSATASSA